MAVEAELTSLKTVSGFEDLSNVEVSLTDEYERQIVEPVCGGGDFSGDVQDLLDGMSLNEEMKFKDALIEELQKSNHELRMKFAEAENKIAKMRVRIEAHCECCTKSKGPDEAADRKNYSLNDWSSTHSYGLDLNCMSPSVWNKVVVNIPEDNTNPYVKVKRWQDTFPREISKETESTSSSYVLRQSPNCVSLRSSNTRPASPDTSGFAGDYVLLPLGESTASSGFRGFENEDSRLGSPQKPLMFRRDLQQIGYAIEEESPSPRLPTVKSSPDERILSSRQQRLKSESPASPNIWSRRSPREFENLETQAIDYYRQAATQAMKYNCIQNEYQPDLSIKARPKDHGIVGRLMRNSDRK